MRKIVLFFKNINSFFNSMADKTFEIEQQSYNDAGSHPDIRYYRR